MNQLFKVKLPFSMLSLVLAILLSSFASITLQAQNTITGKVIGEDGESLLGVNVFQKDTRVGTTTDIDGNYSITLVSVSEPPTLIFSSLGYATKEIAVGLDTVINVTLAEEAEGLDEVVIIGYQAVERRKVLGSISTVKAEEIEKATPVQAFDAIQGRVAGVQILNNNGPGQGFDIRVRGVSTFGAGTSPLYVVDGQQLDNIDNLDPGDIASLEVLKDGATAAIYGSKAANGVVLITTKSGKSGKTRIDITNVTGFNNLVGDLRVVNSEERFLLERIRNGNLDNLTRLERDSLSLLRRNDFDLQDLLTRTAIRNQTNVAFSGGNENLKYYWNTGFLKEEGIVVNSGFKRINTQFRLDFTPTKKLKFGTRTTISHQDKEGLTEGGIFTHLVERLPYLPLQNPDGSFTPTIAGRKNPLAFANLQVRDDRDWRIQTFNYAQYEILPKLTVKSTLGINFRYRKRDDFDPRLIANRFETGFDQGRVRQDLTYDIQQENFVNYRNKWGGHSLGAFAGMQIQKYFIENTDFRSRFFANGYIETLNNAIPGTITGDNNANERHNLYSLFGGFTYDYEDKYLIGATIRRDGSSRFGEQNEFGYFPSATLGWRASKESFLKDSGVVNNLLFKASYGVIGNERIGNYLFTGVLEPGSAYNGLSGIAPTRLGNPELSWEQTESINLGFDLGLLQNRVQINFDVWQKTTSDLLATTPLPEETGFTGIIRNAGNVENRGVDFNITGDIIRTKDFTWTSNFNIGYLENKVTSLANGTDFFAGPNQSYIITEGQSIGSIFGYNNLGVFAYDESNAFTDTGRRLTPNFNEDGDFINYTLDGQVFTGNINQLRVAGRTLQGGDIIWEDLDGDFNITADDRKILGNGLGTTYGGFSHDFRYKNFTMSLLFDFTLNFDIYSRWDELRNDFAAGAESPGPERIYGAWQQPGDVTVYPRLDRVPQNRLGPNSFFVTDGSFIKWRYLRFEYRFGKKILDKIPGVKSMSINFATNNVLTWTNYNGYNPELGNRGNALTPGLDDLRYPNDREFILGIRVQL
ncbi:TonB-dependent receptor [Nonlabens tegetincola]|uniref:TonB-dependent receptor n=1 Tax=Nonlabens tegetincola TaxID=323273 RepID=A0A090Q8H8_9FLAO|nr:TonB-dependent receptor [Nonlabens tegetincola]GAK98048.1 TonB-dependent receptor [Nonlabens tegetincola]